jgi:hypothetical protein
MLTDRKDQNGKSFKPEEIVWSFWETNQLFLPNLAKLFRDLALIQPTSAGIHSFDEETLSIKRLKEYFRCSGKWRPQ